MVAGYPLTCPADFSQYGASDHKNPGDGAYTLPASASGHTLNKIVVHGGWSDAGSDQQAYTVSYSKVAPPTTFVSLGTVNYNPANPTSVQSTTRATLTPANGVLATNVAAVRFDFTTPGSENGWVGYAQLAVYGAPTLLAPVDLAATAGDAQASFGFLNTDLTNGMPYYYVVTALNAGEETGVSGQVSVTPVPAGYQGWLDAYPSIAGTDRAPDADPDHDGVPNGIEFLTGTSPAASTGSAPLSTTVDSAGNLVLHFKRVDATKAYIVAVESAQGLEPQWASFVVTNDAITGPPLTVVENGTAVDNITFTIPSN